MSPRGWLGPVVCFGFQVDRQTQRAAWPVELAARAAGEVDLGGHLIVGRCLCGAHEKRSQNATGSVTSARLCGDEGERFVGWHDADVAEGAEGEQILVAGDDEVGAGAERAGEHGIIIGIARGRGHR